MRGPGSRDFRGSVIGQVTIDGPASREAGGCGKSRPLPEPDFRPALPKSELYARIERRLQGLPALTKSALETPNVQRDSDRPIRRDTPWSATLGRENTRVLRIADRARLSLYLPVKAISPLAHRTLTYRDFVDEMDRGARSAPEPEFTRPRSPNMANTIASSASMTTSSPHLALV